MRLFAYKHGDNKRYAADGQTTNANEYLPFIFRSECIFFISINSKQGAPSLLLPASDS